VNTYKIVGLIMGLAFSAWIVSRLWKALRDGRIAYWRTPARMFYAERATNLALYWFAVAWHAACLGLVLWWFCILPWLRA